jgi:hypothetical protein
MEVAALKRPLFYRKRINTSTPGAAPGVEVFIVQLRRDTEARKGVRAAVDAPRSIQPLAFGNQPKQLRKNARIKFG